jgi:ATP-dependent DNA helicase RecG
MMEGKRKVNGVLDQPLQYLKGIGPRRLPLFQRLRVENVHDLLYFLPWRYEDRSLLQKIAGLSTDGGEGLQTVIGTIRAAEVVITPRRRMKLFEALIDDGSGVLLAVWFNQPFLRNVLKKDQKVLLSGTVTIDRYTRRPAMENPHYEVMEEEGEAIHTGRIVPIYHETRGLTSRQIRGVIHGLLTTLDMEEFLPSSLLEQYRLPTLTQALRDVHFPETGTDLQRLQEKGTRAHKRFSYEEFFLLELGLAQRKKQRDQAVKTIRYGQNGRERGLVERFLALFPYPLTRAQKRVFEEIRRDMDGPHPMHRLIQGDVGCGKTVIALMAMLIAVEGGYQAALMAPTEILAEQHHLNLRSYLERLSIPCWLLTGRRRGTARNRPLQEISEGTPGIVVGTHTLSEKGTVFGRLGLAVIDEQHKFGVLQRASLQDKGGEIDILVMTATPIPRTLAMSLYGDLDVSVVDELPPGRKPVNTRHYREAQRGDAYRFLEKEIREGRQGYIVYPLVEESEKVDLKAAVEMAGHLAQTFPDLRVGLLHGRMKGEEKESVMADFKANAIPILVATTVIEVGVDVPNASVMIVEHAERFGLAQLHQLRGRVGRGRDAAHCLLMTGSGMSPEAWRRIQAMVRTTDGFRIAEEDLSIRGPGEFLGTRQSGIPELRVADLLRDTRILEAARKDAFERIDDDPLLSRPEHHRLRQEMERRWKGRLRLGSV